MNYRKQGLRALGLSVVAALGLMAFMVAGAQANWLVLHNKVVVEPDVTIAASAHTEGKLFVKEETNLEILCAVIESDPTAPILLLEKSTVAHGHLIFKTCKTWQGGKDISAKCKPVEPILAGGLAELKLHTVAGVSDNYVLFKPLTAGGNFTVIKFNTETCALPGSNNVKGEFTAECGHLNASSVFVHLDCENHEVTHLLQEVPETPLFVHELKYGTKSALLNGIALVKIEGPALYVGDEWGGHV